MLDSVGRLKPTETPFILMYHRVLDGSRNETYPCQPGMYVTAKTFRMQIEFLKKNYEVLPLKTLLNEYFNKRNLKNCCSLSFDDGWIDNYSNASLILKDLNVPAAFFLATSFIGTGRIFWSEEVSCFLYYSDWETKYRALKKHIGSQHILKMMCSNRLDEQEKLTNFVLYLKGAKKHIRDKFIAEISEINHTKLENIQTMMDWSQIVEMHQTGLFDFYPHSHNHELLTYMEKDRIAEEILLSKKFIENKLNRDVADIFCYPSGKKNDLVIETLKNFNFRYGIGTKRGVLDYARGPFDINRIGVHEDISSTSQLFRACISRF